MVIQPSKMRKYKVMKLFALPAIILLAVSGFAQTSAPSAVKPKPRTSAKPAVKPTPPATKPAAAPAATPAPETPASTADAGKPILTIESEPITAADFESILEGLPPQYQAQARGPMKRQIAEEIVRLRLLANEARKRGLDKDKVVQARIAFQTQNMLAGALFNEFAKSAKVEDAAVRKFYDEHKNEYEQAQARHILVKFKGSPVPQREGKPELSEEEALAKAQELKKRLAGGEDFAKLAQAESDDTGSGANGGDLGLFKEDPWCPHLKRSRSRLPSVRSLIRSRVSSVIT